MITHANYRALCAELLPWAEHAASHHYPPPELLARARALLDAPATEAVETVIDGRIVQVDHGPRDTPCIPASEAARATNEELLALRSWSSHGPTFDSDLVDFARAVLSRYGSGGLERCDRLQQEQRRFREPERTILCDILANGTLLPDPQGTRYGIPHPAPVPPSVDSDVIRALVKAEAALADIGDAEREPGDDLAWCERRAAETLPFVREALSFCGTAHPAPVPVGERLPGMGDCDAEVRCWFLFLLSNDHTWTLEDRTSALCSGRSHWLPQWTLPLPGDQPLSPGPQDPPR